MYKKLILLLVLVTQPILLLSQPAVIFTSTATDAIGQSEFSLSETKKVRFTKGNLLYQPSTKTWRIAPRQYDFVGGYNSKDLPLGQQGTIWENGVRSRNDNGNHKATYTGWVDVFAWGTSGWYGDDEFEIDTMDAAWRKENNPNKKVTCNPYEIPSSATNYNFILGGNNSQGMKDAYALADWGVRNNLMLGGGASDSMFRTPTKEEFDYLLTERENATKLRARACIRLAGTNNAPDTVINGLILLPDDWNSYILPGKDIQTDFDGNELYATNEFTSLEWQILEESGAIFFPATGGSQKFNRSGFYWSATPGKSGDAWNIEFGGYGWQGSQSDPQMKTVTRISGRAVRLVMEINDDTTKTPVIDTTRTCNNYTKLEVPGEGGFITAVQDTLDSCNWILTATADTGYVFAYWIDLDGTKTCVDTFNFTIDATIDRFAIQALFAKTNVHVVEWGDTITYRPDTIEAHEGQGTGIAEIYSGENKICSTEAYYNCGEWKHAIPDELTNGAYDTIRVILYDRSSRPIAIVDTVVVPIIVKGSVVASSTTMTDNVYVLDNSTLTFDQNTSIDSTLTIFAGGKVVVEDTLVVNNLILRGNGIQKTWAQLVTVGTVNNLNDTIYYEYTINNEGTYQLALPYETKLEDITGVNGEAAPEFAVKYYNSNRRSFGNNPWSIFTDSVFEAGKGYMISTEADGNITLRFPMKATLLEDSIDKKISIVTTSPYNGKLSDKNWNLIGSPYLSEKVMGTDIDSIKVDSDSVNVRYIAYSEDGFSTYKQDFMLGQTIKPFNCYLLQVNDGDSLTFIQHKDTTVQNTESNTEFGIIMLQEDNSDLFGVLFGNYMESYEINADLVKGLENNIISIYASDDLDYLTFIALSTNEIDNPIKLGFNLSSLDQVTISFDNARYPNTNITELYLADISLNRQVNLMNDDYSFMPNYNQEEGRLYLGLKPIIDNPDPGTPTSIYNTGDSTTIETVYDILGHRVEKTSLKPNRIYIVIDNVGNTRKLLVY